MPRATRRKAERFPLTLHRQTGQWCKVFRLPSGHRKTVYFGTDPDAALAKYVSEREEWQAGRNPRETTRTTGTTTGLSLADCVNAFLTRSKGRVATGELSPRSFADYKDIGAAMLAHFGRHVDPGSLGPQQFSQFRVAMAARYAPTRLSKIITVCRMVIRWAYETELLDRLPRFGPDFKTAGKRAVRAAKAEAGAKLLTAAEIRAILQAATPTVRAMVLLGINAGLGNADVAALPLSALDLAGGWLNFPRPKTGVARRVPLWPETVQALRQVLAERQPQEGCESLVFLTVRGRSWVTVTPDGRRRDGIIPEFRRTCIAAGVHRPRMGFYWLRHTFQTIGDGTKDFLAVAHLMGHADGSIGGHYREMIDDSRLRAVTEHVHRWLFGPAATGEGSLRVVG